jgi:hypothetical protein
VTLTFAYASDTEPFKFIIAYTVRTGQPNTVWPKTESVEGSTAHG